MLRHWPPPMSVSPSVPGRTSPSRRGGGGAGAGGRARGAGGGAPGAAGGPPPSCRGSGTASVTISDDESDIAYEVTYQDLTGPVLAAHIHYGAEDEAGGVILPLAAGASPFSGTLT